MEVPAPQDLNSQEIAFKDFINHLIVHHSKQTTSVREVALNTLLVQHHVDKNYRKPLLEILEADKMLQISDKGWSMKYRWIGGYLDTEFLARRYYNQISTEVKPKRAYNRVKERVTLGKVSERSAPITILKKEYHLLEDVYMMHESAITKGKIVSKGYPEYISNNFDKIKYTVFIQDGESVHTIPNCDPANFFSTVDLLLESLRIKYLRSTKR